ncbi:hypothetical protein KAR91_53255 [Candidatus Pacearchaeota archaeon]|nr:hypothetical protein [Candidatus Pacearchaeota archaeon]
MSIIYKIKTEYEALQFNGTNKEDCDKLIKRRFQCAPPNTPNLYDYIVLSSDGDIFLCNPSYFESTYEKVT